MVSESIYAPLIEGPQGPEYPVLNGVNQYITIPAWSGVSAGAYVEYETDNDDGLVVNSTQPITEIGRVGASYHSGNIKSVRMREPSPLQGRRAMAGDGLSRYAQIPEIALAGDFEIEFWWIRGDNSFANNAASGIISSSSSDTHVRLFDSLHTTLSDNIQIRIAGSPDFNAQILSGVAQGQHVHIKLTRSLGTIEIYVDGALKATTIDPDIFNFDIIGQYNSTNFIRSCLANLVVRDLTNNNPYIYNNRNDSGNKLRNIADPSGATDGTWYENGVAMTPAAAEVARGRLPMISRHYPMHTPGRVEDVLGGTADGTLVGLTAADWQPV